MVRPASAEDASGTGLSGGALPQTGGVTRTRRALGAMPALAVGLAVAAAACSGTTEACPDVGWLNAITVELSGDAARVDLLILCAAAGCPADVLEGEPVDGDGDGVPDAIVGVPAGDTTWTFSTWSMATPDQVAVRALDAAGATITEQTLPARWQRTGGTERCGGPEMGTVELTIV